MIKFKKIAIEDLMKKRINGLLTFYTDIDDTVIMHDLSEYDDKRSNETISKSTLDVLEKLTTFTILDPLKTNDNKYKYIRNDKNINTIKKFYKLGYTIIAWSKTGSDWAERVCKHLDIDKYISCYLTKPTYYLDDKDVNEWIGPRIWRDADGKRHKEKFIREEK